MLGVRYEYTTTPIGENRQTLNAISDTPSILVPQAGNQPLVFGDPKLPKNNWAPRIGFAYSPGSSGTTSIRGGFGMAYDTLYDNIGSLAVPPQIGSTENVAPPAPGLHSGPELGGGFPARWRQRNHRYWIRPTALPNTANWLPPKEQDPYSINWNFGVQHAFGKNYSAEINYVGHSRNPPALQDILSLQASVTPTNFLPTYIRPRDQATLDALPLSL